MPQSMHLIGLDTHYSINKKVSCRSIPAFLFYLKELYIGHNDVQSDSFTSDIKYTTAISSGTT